METTEALGYLKGLLDGLDLDDNKKETKVFKAIIEVLENLNEDVLDITEEIDGIEEQMDVIDDDLATLEEFVYEDDDDFSCDGCCGCDGDYNEETEFELECPNCQEVFVIDEETAMEGVIECPNCGERFELIEDNEEEQFIV